MWSRASQVLIQRRWTTSVEREKRDGTNSDLVIQLTSKLMEKNHDHRPLLSNFMSPRHI